MGTSLRVGLWYNVIIRAEISARLPIHRIVVLNHHGEWKNLVSTITMLIIRTFSLRLAYTKPKKKLTLKRGLTERVYRRTH